MNPLSPGEVGLLTVAERRGEVRVPVKVDRRADVAALERITLLEGLRSLGLVAESQPDQDEGERRYEITDAGRAALAELDRR